MEPVHRLPAQTSYHLDRPQRDRLGVHACLVERFPAGPCQQVFNLRIGLIDILNAAMNMAVDNFHGRSITRLEIVFELHR